MSRRRRTSQRCLCSFLFSFRMCDHHICFNLQRHLIYAAPPLSSAGSGASGYPSNLHLSSQLVSFIHTPLYFFLIHPHASSFLFYFFFFFISIIQTSIEASHHLTHKALELHFMCSDANIQRFTSMYFGCCCCRCSGLHYLFISSCHANYRCRLRANNILLSPQECPVGVLHQLLSPSSESMLNASSDFL